MFRGASSITSDRAPDVTIADIGRSPRRIARASMGELDRWAERILTAGSLDDVLR